MLSVGNGDKLRQCWLMSSLQNCFCRHKSLSDFCGNWLMLIAWFLFWMILYCHMLVLCWYVPEDEVGDFHYWKTCHLSHLFQILIYWSCFSFWRYRALSVIIHWFAKIMWITVWLNIFLKKKNLVTLFPKTVSRICRAKIINGIRKENNLLFKVVYSPAVLCCWLFGWPFGLYFTSVFSKMFCSEACVFKTWQED